MRMSVRKTDLGYSESASLYQPFLDGKKGEKCITADEDRGCLLRYKTDENNQPILNKSKTDVLTEELFGHVEIRRKT